MAGGLDPSANALISAELYDPASGTFAPTGDMIQGRGYHAATLLAGGRVLIAGGQRNTPFIAEGYDPSSAKFLSVGPLPFYPSQLTLLADGKVLIQGMDAADFVRGFCLPAGCRFQPALYDPNRGFRLDEPIREYWTIVTATLLTTGKVLDTMLVTEDERETDVAELYDSSTGTFAARKMAALRRYATATLLPDATVLIAGFRRALRLIATSFGPSASEHYSWLCILLLLGALSLADRIPSAHAESTVLGPKLQIVSPPHWSLKEGCIVATIRNNTGQKFRAVTVSFNLYDEHGRFLRVASSTVSNVNPHGEYEVKVAVNHSHAPHVGLRSIVPVT